MWQIILLILKITGILLAVLLCILICALLLILFVPIRYQMKGSADLAAEEKLQAEIKIHWLFHFVSATIRYSKSIAVYVRLFGIRIYDSSRPEKGKKQRRPKKDKHKKNEVSDAEDGFTPDETGESEMEQTVSKEPREEETVASTLDEEHKTKIIKQIFNTIKNIRYTLKRIYAKIKNVFGNLRYYLDVFQSKTFLDVYAFTKEQLFKIISILRPKKCKMDFVVGTGDPAATGQVLSIYGMLYPFVGNYVNLEPDFEQVTLKGRFFIQGSVRCFTLLWVAFKIYRDKNIRQLLKMLHKEEV